VPCAFGIRSTITPHPGLPACRHRLRRNDHRLQLARTGLATTFGAGFFAARLGRERFTEALVRRAAAVLLVLDERAALVAIIALAGPLCLSSPDSPSVTTTRLTLPSYFLRSTMFSVSALIGCGLFTQRRESPGRLWMIALHATFTTSVRMVNRVHGHATNGWA